MRFIFCSLIIVVFFLNITFANKTIDTLNTLSYFPMHVGDKWQYMRIYTFAPFDTIYETYTITADTIMPNNKSYFEFDYINNVEYFRIDSTELNVYKYDPTKDSEIVYYELIFPDTNTTHSYFQLIDTTFGQVGYLSIYKKQNIYWWTNLLEDQERYLSQDIGLSYIDRDYGFGLHLYFDLVSAQIDSVIYGQFITSIDHANKINNFILHQNYPNPFNQTTIIKFSLEKIEDVKIEIFNTIGEKLEILLKKRLPAGYHHVEFNAYDLASGVYLYRIEAGNYQQIRKMILLK